MDILLKLLFFIFMLGGLIFAHELGHFLAAMRFNIRVKEFGLGLPPRAVRLFEWRGTSFTLNWIPLGGFVRPLGEFDPSVAGGLAASKPWQRIVVFAAGPLMNLVVGYLILVVAFSLGWPDQLKVIDVLPDSPAASAGLQVNDIFLRANGQVIHDNYEWGLLVKANLERPIALEVQRGEAVVPLTLTPNTAWAATAHPTGLAFTRLIVRYSPLAASRRALERIALQIHETVMLPVRALLGQLAPDEARLSGLVGLKQISDKILDDAIAGRWLYPVLNLTALISVGLGFMNLLPFAALDGGRIAFALLEILRRRPVDARREKLVHVVGMVALLGFMLALVVQDLLRPVF